MVTKSVQYNHYAPSFGSLKHSWKFEILSFLTTFGSLSLSNSLFASLCCSLLSSIVALNEFHPSFSWDFPKSSLKYKNKKLQEIYDYVQLNLNRDDVYSYFFYKYETKLTDASQKKTANVNIFNILKLHINSLYITTIELFGRWLKWYYLLRFLQLHK